MSKIKIIWFFRSIITTIIFSLIYINADGQQVPIYSQYIMNGFLINPSLAGRDGYSSFNLTVREQWVGMTGAPSTYAASFETRLLKNSFMLGTPSVRLNSVKPTVEGKVGLGGYVFNDKNGIIRRSGVQMAYSYHISTGHSNDGYPDDLAFGLALTIYQYAVNTEGLIYSYDDDPYLNNYSKSVFIPDFNFGISYTSTRYYIGFAATNLLRGSLIFDNSTDSKNPELGYYFLTGGVKFQLADNWKIEPSTFIRTSDMFFKAMQADITGRVFYKNDYWAGLSWRTNDAIVLLFGLRVNKFYFGYAFDIALTDIRKQSFGTHEVTFAVKFGQSPRRYRWINAY